jgi:uncharacterized protein (TIGR02284 family)
MNNPTAIKTLASLYRIVEAGEKGYAVASANANNRALKLLFSSFAQQRLNFKEEIFAEMQRLGGSDRPRSSLLGVIHRGRIDIFAVLTIGEENVEKMILKEIMVGERVALRVYQRILKKELPSDIRALLERQAREVRKVVDQIQAMRGINGKRSLLRLYDSKSDAEQAQRELKEAGFSGQEVSIQDFEAIADRDLYQHGRGTTISETVISGAAGGGTFGLIASLLVVANMLLLLLRGSSEQPLDLFTFLFTFSTLLTGGIFVGAVIGWFMGWGIFSGHEYVAETVKRGEVLLDAKVDEARASRAWKVMYQSAMIARARGAKKALA